VRRAAGSNRGTPYGETLAELRTEIEEDRAALASIMARLGMRVDEVRKAIAWSAEKLGRLKLNGKLTGYSRRSSRSWPTALARSASGWTTSVSTPRTRR
jgi:hypothetical protein